MHVQHAWLALKYLADHVCRVIVLRERVLEQLRQNASLCGQAGGLGRAKELVLDAVVA